MGKRHGSGEHWLVGEGGGGGVREGKCSEAWEIEETDKWRKWNEEAKETDIGST